MKFVIVAIVLTIIVVDVNAQLSGTNTTDIVTGLTGTVAGLKSLGEAVVSLVKQFPALVDVVVQLVGIIRDLILYLPQIIEGISFASSKLLPILLSQQFN